MHVNAILAPASTQSRASLASSPPCSLTTSNTIVRPHCKQLPAHRQRKRIAGMCHHYSLKCPLCERTSTKLYHCAELTARRITFNNEQAASARNPRPSTEPAAPPAANASATIDTPAATQIPQEWNCPSFVFAAEALVPNITCSAPNYAAAKHLCQHCDFHFWYKLHWDDEEGREVPSDGEKRRRQRLRSEHQQGKGLNTAKPWITPA